MKQALFITTNPELGGAQKWTYDQITLVSNSYEVCLATGNVGWLSEIAKDQCKEILIDKGLYAFSSLGYLFRLYKFVKRNKIDIIIASSANAGIYARLLKVLIPAVSIIYVSHGWSSIYRGNRFYQWIEKALSYLSSSILVVSQNDYDKAIDTLHISAKKLKLIENSIFPYSPKRSDEYFISNTSRLQVIMVARFDIPKRQDLLIQVAKRLPNIDFYFVGEGSQLQSLKKDASLNTKFLGTLNNVEEVVEKSDIFILLSDSEGMPLSVLEALACAKPLLLSSIPSMATFVEKNGLLVANNVDAIYAALLEMKDKDLESMGKASRKIFDARFNLEIKKQEYLDYYESFTK